ncbi:MAG TPA: LppX_LprAFG lipoprotein, partial [Ktedonobacteraceae bacterium]|nr:LppX_LprAFG lipoprotein [Ktedonobacteraceae bacterium]
MLQINKKRLFLAGLGALLFLLTACSMPGLAGTSPTPEQTLQNSAKVMSQLKSVHFDIPQATLAMRSNNNSNSGVSFTLTGQGDAVSPDQASVDLLLGKNPVLALVSKGQTVYVQVTDGTWYSVNKSQVKNVFQGLFSQGITTQLGQIMTILQSATLTDHGQETLNGVSLDHITATLDGQTLQNLNSLLNSYLPQSAQSAQNQIKQAAMDLWIDQSTGYVYQTKLDVTVQIDASSLRSFLGQSAGNLSGVLPVELQAQIDFSKFNQPITIQA